jgi:hypothetical protein
VDNKFPHMTMLLKGGASAVESNHVIEALTKIHPEILEQRDKKVLSTASSNWKAFVAIILSMERSKSDVKYDKVN